jgi:hypothetical protein
MRGKQQLSERKLLSNEIIRSAPIFGVGNYRPIRLYISHFNDTEVGNFRFIT